MSLEGAPAASPSPSSVVVLRDRVGADSRPSGVNSLLLFDQELKCTQVGGSLPEGIFAVEEEPSREASPLRMLPEIRDILEPALLRALSGDPVSIECECAGKRRQVQAYRLTEESIKPAVGILLFSEPGEPAAPGREVEAQAAWQADVLTGLPNRAVFMDRVGQAVRESKRYGTSVAVLFVDLDHFKSVNDSHGHEQGDELLRQVASRIRACLRKSDSLARLGGDEFAIVLAGLPPGKARSGASLVAEKVLTCLGVPFRLGSAEVLVSGSIGISLFPDDAGDAITLLRHSDAAMYSAKLHGRNRVGHFTLRMAVESEDAETLGRELRSALDSDGLQLVYQPIRNLASGEIVAVEALLRWQHPTRGLLPASEFIAAAAAAGLNHRLDEWVLRAVCSEAAHWRSKGRALPRVSINLAAGHQHADVPNRVQRELAAAELPPSALGLEISERHLDEQPDQSQWLAELRATGIQVMIDEFGTGGVALASLVSHPVEGLKIHREVIAGIGADWHSEVLIRGILALARNLGLPVVAVGVETEAQYRFLVAEGCHFAQGHFWDAPDTSLADVGAAGVLRG